MWFPLLVALASFFLYPMALMMLGLWCFGLLCFGSMFSGILVGCFIVSLSFCRLSCVACDVYSVWSYCSVVVSSFICALKSFIGLLPRSIRRIRHQPPLWVPRRSWRSLNVLLCLDVRSLALYLHPHKRCVFVSGWLHFLRSIRSGVPECYGASCICKRLIPRLLHRNLFCICTGLISTLECWSQPPCLSPLGVVFQRCLSLCCPCWLW